MSPLKVLENGQVVAKYGDNEELSIHAWTRKVFSCFSSDGVIRRAISRGKVETQRRPPLNRGLPERICVSVSQFPRIIEGFQEVGGEYYRERGQHPHPWSLGVDAKASVFEVKPFGYGPKGKRTERTGKIERPTRTLRFTRE